MNALKWIEKWFSSNCDGDWEHSSRIRIETLDNPGWSIIINLEGTIIENAKFEIKDIERTEKDWIYCCLDEKYFKGAGGITNLEEILLVFIDWVEENSKTRQ